MASPMRFLNPAGYAGLGANLTALVSSGARFLEARLSLFSSEAKGAAKHLVTLVACFAAALFLIVVGYFFLLVFVVIGLAHLLHVSPIWTSLGVGLLHFGGAALCVLVARGQFKRPVFRDTAAVLKEDTEWLKNLDQTKAKRS